jgi:MFS family permease
MPEEAAAAEQMKEKCDPCARKAIFPMTCISPACRMHVISTLLLILSFFLFADQQLVAPNLSQISRDLNLTDAERDLYLGGLVPLCFFAVGTPFTVFMGPIIDRVHRRNLFVVLIFLGVNTVAGLLITRAVTGIAMAAAEPLIFSMLSDMCVVFCSWWWLWWLRWWCWWWNARERKCARGGVGGCGVGVWRG